MSDSILSLLADELDVPPKQAKKLLIAMLREVKKRARREGVRLPDFGTFREANGQITFEPSPSLARAVNSRFEGLQSEDLDTAPETEEDEEEDDEGPSTITLGYQESEWSPLDEESDDAADGGEDDDTEEFEVPAAEEAADTDEFQAPDPTDRDAASDAASSEEETSDTEELYPFVEDVPEGDSEDEEAEPAAGRSAGAEPDRADAAAERAEAADEEHDSLSGIWDSDEEEDAEDDSESFTLPDDDAAPAPASEPDPSTEAAPEPESAPSAEPSSAPDAPTSEVEIDPEVREPADEEASSDESGSTGLRVATGVLVVLLLGGAAWYVLGRRGTVQPPQKTFAQLKGQVQPYVENLSTQDVPLVGSTSEEPPSATADVRGESSAAAPSETGDDPSSPSDTGSDTGEPSGDPAEATTTSESEAAASTDPASDTPQTGSARSIDRAQGGWTIVVGSRTEAQSAQSLVEKYRAVFNDQTLPVDVITGTVDNTTRYRVGVGQFESRSDAQDFLNTAQQKLPQGAWPLSL